MLICHDLSFAYRRRAVLRDINLAAAAGQVTALVGPNGSGKSTLLRCIAGALRSDVGRITFNDTNLLRLSARERSRLIAYVPQNNLAPFAFTVAELVGLGSAVSRTLPPESHKQSDGQRRVQAALEQMELGGYEHRALPTLSGGEQQRAAVARALAQETPCLLLDEPTAHLDVRHQTRLLQTARHAARNENRVVLVVLHDLNLAALWADNVAVLHQGRIVAQGTTDSVLLPAVLEPVYQIAFRTTNQHQTLLLPVPEESIE